MDEDIIEGEVIDSYDPREDPRIAFEVEDFQQHMDDMKCAYVFAADMISRGAFQSPPQPVESQAPGKGYVAVRVCGKVLVATGSWLLAKFPAPSEELRDEKPQDDWAWANEDTYKHPVMLPLPDLYKNWSL